MTLLPGTPENFRASLIRIDANPDPELDVEGDYVLGESLRVGWFASRAGSMVLARRFDIRDEDFETSASFGRVDVQAARSFGRTARAASVFFDVPSMTDIDDIAAEGASRVLSGTIDPVRMKEIMELLDVHERGEAVRSI